MAHFEVLSYLPASLSKAGYQASCGVSVVDSTVPSIHLMEVDENPGSPVVENLPIAAMTMRDNF